MGTFFFFLCFWIVLVVLAPVGIIAAVLRLCGARRASMALSGALARAWAKLVIASTRSEVVAEGLENIPTKGGVCFVANHSGNFDVLVALSLIRRPFGFTAKKEAAFMPFIGMWVWLLGGVFIDRRSARKAFAAIEAGAKRIAAGGAMIIFPEGTRSRGRSMGPFRAGAFKLATMADAPIVPVAIEGSHQVWEASGRIRPARIRVSFGLPVPTAGLSAEERKALPGKVRAAIAERLPAGLRG